MNGEPRGALADPGFIGRREARRIDRQREVMRRIRAARRKAVTR